MASHIGKGVVCGVEGVSICVESLIPHPTIHDFYLSHRNIFISDYSIVSIYGDILWT